MHYRDERVWGEIERQMRDGLAVGSEAARLNEAARRRYGQSITEQEATAGILEALHSREHVHCFFRTIEPDAPGQWLDDVAGRAHVQRLKESLRRFFGRDHEDNVHEYGAAWEGDGPSKDYIDALRRDVVSALTTIIVAELEKERADPLELERAEHLAFGAERSRHFVGRTEPLRAIAGYLAGDAPTVLAVLGAPGVGKTALIARAVTLASGVHHGAASLVRFAGTTPRSADKRTLLRDLLIELRQDRRAADEDVPASYVDLARSFRNELSIDRPHRVLLFIDALDQLSTVEEDADLGWLPSELNVNVRVVVSAADGSAAAHLQRRLPAEAVVRIKPMPSAEAAALLSAWLAAGGRTLQDHQRSEVLRAFAVHGLPLHLRLVYEEARQWPSFAPPAQTMVADTIAGVVRKLIARLSRPEGHGEILVSRSLAYLAAAKHGLSEDELLDLLWRDDEVREELVTRSPLSPDVDALPDIVLSRLLLDLDPYLNERQQDAKRLLGFYHRQLETVVANDLLANELGRVRHGALATFFAAQDLQLHGSQSGIANLRKLSELPFQQVHGPQPGDVFTTLTDFDFLQAKVSSFESEERSSADGRIERSYPGVFLLLEDLERSLRGVIHADLNHEDALRRISDALLLSSQTLARDPSQLAPQLPGRLLDSGNDALEPLLELASSWLGTTWLRPIAPTLLRPGGALVRLLLGHEGTPRSIAVSPDGLVAASAGNSSPDQTIRIWDVQGSGALHVLPHQAESGSFTPLAFGHDGNLLLSGYGGEVRVFDVVSGGFRPPLVARDAAVTALVAASAAPVCLSAWGDGVLMGWDLERNGSFEIARDGEPVLSLSLSSDGTRAAAGTAAGLELVDVVRARVAARCGRETGLRAHDWETIPVVLSSDGRRVFHGAPLRSWQVENDEIAGSAVPAGVRVLAVTQGGDAICAPSAGDTGGLTIYSLDEASAPRNLPTHPSGFSAAAVTPDGQRVVCGDFDHAVSVWHPHAPDLPAQPAHHSTRVMRLAAVRTHTVSVSADGEVKAWALADGREADTELSARAIADGRRQWAHVDSRTVTRSATRRFRRRTSERSWTWATTPDGTASVGSSWDGAKCSEAEEPLDASGNQRIAVHRLHRRQRWLLGHTAPVTALAITDDGEFAISGGFGRIVRVWDLRRLKQLHALRGHAGVVWCAAAVPGRSWAVTASGDRTVILWDLPRGVALATFSGDYGMMSCAVASDGQHVMVGDLAGAVHTLRIEHP